MALQIPLLYHSFPRRRNRDADDKSLAVLSSILDHGLLITPEIVDWVTSNGTPFRVSQKRVCFTAVEPEQLVAHARLFGELSIGFHRHDLEAIGATPVFYVSRSRSGRNPRANLGGFHLERIYQLATIIESLRKGDRSFKFNGKPIDLVDMEAFVRVLSGQYYPIEDLEDGRERHYFSQREWRIQGNLLFGGVPLSRRLTDQEARHVAALDPEFFQRQVEFPTGAYPVIAQCMIIPNVGDIATRDAIASVVTPKRLEPQVRAALHARNLSAEVTVLAND